MKWEAVQRFFREGEDGSLEFNPEALPPEVRPSRPGPEDDPEAAARAKAEADRLAQLNHGIRHATSAMGNKLAEDQELQRTLEEELRAEPGGDLIMAHARAVMKTVNVENRNEKAWRNAISLGKGATESKRRPMWEGEIRKRAEEDLIKAHGLHIHRSTPKKTDAELVAELSDEQKQSADRMGVSHEAFARNLHTLQGGKR